jgi:hypothetical protein
MGRPESARRARVAELEAIARQEASGENLPPAQPIAATTPQQEAELPAHQRQGLRDLRSLSETLSASNSGLTDEQQREARRDIATADSLFRQYGGFLEMPSTEKRNFQTIMRNLAKLSEEVTTRTRGRRPTAAATDNPNIRDNMTARLPPGVSLSEFGN